MITMWGLKNCDTCRYARKWLEQEGLDHVFHDLRSEDLSLSVISSWVDKLGIDVLVNKRGTTWRALPDGVKDSLDVSNAPMLLFEAPALMKRPIFDVGETVFVGFTDEVKQALIMGHA